MWFTLYRYYFKRTEEEKRKDDEINEEIIETMIESLERWFGGWGIPLFLTFIMLMMAFHLSFGLIGIIEGIRQFFIR